MTQFDVDEVQRRYAAMTPDQFASLIREELTPVGQQAYDREIARRSTEEFRAEETRKDEEFTRRVQAAAASAREVAATNVRSSSPVVNRYRDAYRVGSALVGLGNAIKIAGAVFAGLILLVALAVGGSFALAGTVIAAINGGLFWVCGVVVAAQGQILQATLDTAVASSHFLTDPQRAEAMGLPRTLADRSAA